MIKIMKYKSTDLHRKRPDLVKYLRNHLTLLANRHLGIGSGMAHDLDQERPTVMFIAWDHGKPIGWLSISFNPGRPQMAQIGCYITSEYRRQKIGTRLVTKAKAWCKIHNLTPISNSWDYTGRKFYETNDVVSGAGIWASFDRRKQFPEPF